MGFVDDSLSQKVPRWLLALLRIYLGVLFLIAALHKLGAREEWPSRMQAFLTNGLRPAPSGSRGLRRRHISPLVLEALR